MSAWPFFRMKPIPSMRGRCLYQIFVRRCQCCEPEKLTSMAVVSVCRKRGGFVSHQKVTEGWVAGKSRLTSRSERFKSGM